jgi:hypothetical protein
MIKEKTGHMCIHIVFVTFILIFKFIFIYLLHIFVLKIEDIFGKRKRQLSSPERGYFLYLGGGVIDIMSCLILTVSQNILKRTL